MGQKIINQKDGTENKPPKAKTFGIYHFNITIL